MTLNRKFFAFSQPIENFFKFGDRLHIVWKDVNSTFLGCSELLEAETGLTISNIIGLNDRDLVWGDRAAKYRQDEETVINSRLTHCIYEPAHTVTGEIELLTFKTPMIGSSGLVAGIFQVSFVLEQNSFPEVAMLLNHLNLMNPNPLLLPLSNPEVMKQLSAREQECLFHLAHAKSVKEIAKLLACSPKTVETHLSNIKRKLNCSARARLVARSFRDNN